MYDSIPNRSNNTNITVSYRLTNTPTITPNTHPQQHLLFLQTSNTQAFLTITHLMNTIAFSLQDGLPPEKLYQKDITNSWTYLCHTVRIMQQYETNGFNKHH